MDIKLVRKQFQVEFANLNTANLDSVDIAAQDFFDFIYDTVMTHEIADTLPANTIDIAQWMQSLYNTQFSLPRNKQERISFLLAVLDKYKDDLMVIAPHFRAGTNHIIDHIRKYIDSMVKPIYQYFDNELHIKELEVSPVSTTSITANNSIIINGNNYGSVSQTNIETIRLLSQLSEVLQKSDALTDEQKLEATNNIDTVKNQIVSPKPHAQIIKLAWQTVSAMADIAGASDLVIEIAKLIGSLNS